MKTSNRPILISLSVAALLASSTMIPASAEEADPWQHADSAIDLSSEADDSATNPLSDADLDRILAPIALYPDTLLSHILVASTYPLELVQLARWRGDNASLSEPEALAAVEDRDWDPSVKALAPFTDLLHTLTEDLDWLEKLGNAFLLDEQRLLASVQDLRRRARDQGTLSDNDYIEVQDEAEEIVIQPVRREVIYVPYYDTRVVYGPWWHSYAPYYWHHPAHYHHHDGFYWSGNFFISSGFYFSSFHWRHRHLLVDYSWRRHHRNTPYHAPHSLVSKRKYQHWHHNPQHRRNVRYVHSDNRPRHFGGDTSRRFSGLHKSHARSFNQGREDAAFRHERRQPDANRRHDQTAIPGRQRFHEQPHNGREQGRGERHLRRDANNLSANTPPARNQKSHAENHRGNERAVSSRQHSPIDNGRRPADRVTDKRHDTHSRDLEQTRTTERPRHGEKARNVERPRHDGQARNIERSRQVSQARNAERPRDDRQARNAERSRHVEQAQQAARSHHRGDVKAGRMAERRNHAASKNHNARSTSQRPGRRDFRNSN